ncbi:unnamed protein product [Bursaphelenchus okinawaensis]|uniref:SAP domain-containing protein n=1 Tax=Bursaphelenchus okinawaensis TaxID=465554 RepID=A0A811L7Q4_9BILA|nr:unnamed protein product [Bursaphelenchus okinawaensis]CAG9118220.1 unnamed protein product [Bursaphelenchus okinawaensis]
MDARKQRLLSMTYNEIRALCRTNGIKAVGTKAKMVETLSETMVEKDETVAAEQDENMDQGHDETPVQQQDVNMEEEAMDTEEQKENRNNTFTMEEGEVSVVPKEVLKAHADISLDESYVTGNLFTPDESPAVAPVLEVKKKTEKVVEASVRPTRATRNNAGSKLLKPGFSKAKATDRFASIHKKNFDKMESIEEAQKKLQNQRAKYVKAASEATVRLATPKRDRSAPKFSTPKTPTSANFKFGKTRPENIEQVQKPFDKEKAVASRLTRAAKEVRQPETDVKKLTMQKKRTNIKLTVPDCSERIEQLATPKSAGPVSISKERRSYTPKTTPYKYVDTTKMSDAELRAFDARQKRLEARSRRLNFQ